MVGFANRRTDTSLNQLFPVLLVGISRGSYSDMPQRTALLIRCSPEDATRIHGGATAERRTVSGYILNILDRVLKIEDSLSAQLAAVNRVLTPLPRAWGDKTTLLIRCNKEEANHIRVAAKRREATISGFIVYSLQRFWAIAAGRHAP